MKNKLIAKTLVASLVFQNMAFAGSRAEGVGNDAVINAQAQMALLHGNLSHLDAQLGLLENNINNRKSDGSTAAGLGIITGAAATVGSVLGLLNLTSGREGAGLIIQVIGSVGSIASYAVSILQTNKVSIDGKLQYDIDAVKAKVDMIRSTSDDKSVKTATREIDLKIAELESTFFDQNKKQKQIAKNEILAIAGQIVSLALSLVVLKSNNRYMEEVGGRLVLATSMASQVAAMYYSTRDLDQNVLLNEIKSTRASIAVAMESLNN